MITEIEDENHLFELLPGACIRDRTSQGDCEEICKFWVKELKLSIPKAQCIELLAPWGAWTRKELAAESKQRLNVKLLWIAASVEI